MKIGQRAFDLIVAQEVTSQAYYIRHYTSPEWPGGASGVTVGIGYDLGMASRSKIQADWGPHVTPSMLSVMTRCAGVSGLAARDLLPQVKNTITIPWSSAISVFANRDMPQWTAAVCAMLPHTDTLEPDGLGVLVSIAYNRGCSFNNQGDRYTEMRAIKGHMNGMLAAIPADIRSMERLWPTVKGLRDRRAAEAALFQTSLTDPRAGAGAEATVGATPDVVDPEIPLNAGPARTKPPTTTATQHGTAGAIVVAGAGAAYAAGFPWPTIIVIGIGAAVVAGIVWWLIYRNRNPT